MMKYKFTLSIGFHGAEHSQIIDLTDWVNYSKEELEKMSKEDLEENLDYAWEEWASQFIDVGIEKV